MTIIQLVTTLTYLIINSMDNIKVSDYVMNMDFTSLYPGVQRAYSVTSEERKKISKIKKILDNINDTERT